MAAAPKTRKKGPLDAYLEKSDSDGKGKPKSRVQSGPLRHGQTSKTSRYSPVDGRKSEASGSSAGQPKTELGHRETATASSVSPTGKLIYNTERGCKWI